MKKILLPAILLSAFMITCGDNKNTEEGESTAKDTITTTMNVEDEAEEIEAVKDTVITVTGKVIGINQGKDGYTAKVRSSAGPDYYATISIPNMSDPKQYRAVKEGDIITVLGEPFKVENDTYIKVSKLE